MTTAAGAIDRAVSDPIGLIVDMVTAVEHRLARETIRAVVQDTAGGRAKSRRLAAALAARPEVLVDGRSPAPRVVGDLLLALRKAGSSAVSPPVCAECGKLLRTMQRHGQDWLCAVCGHTTAPCAICGELKQIVTRDRAGRPRCARCPEVDDRDPVEVICAVVAVWNPGVDREVVADALARCCRRPSYRRQVAWAVEADPALLTGDGHRAPLRVIPRFIDALHAAGVAGIVRPTCPGCHRVVRIDKPLDGQRVCRTCIAHSRYEPCARCGTRREPVTRDRDGGGICANCFTTDPVNLETCINCGRLRSVSRRTTDGPLCSPCPGLKRRRCSICGETTPCGISRITGLPWCPRCQRRTARCSSCNQTTAVVSGTTTQPLCGDCTRRPAWLADCVTCNDPDYPHPGECRRCLVNKRLDEIMGPDIDNLPPGLRALREDIATAEHHITAMRWVTKTSVAPILSGLATGRIPLTHEALDELPDTAPLAHIRQTLVSIGALPDRDEQLIRLERFLTGFIAAEEDRDRRKLLRRYVIWHLLRRLRSRNNGRPASRQQFFRVQNHARAAVAFLDWLDAHNLTLATCRQGELERWLIDDSGAYRYETGSFIRWAHSHKLTPAYVPAYRWRGPVGPLDDQHRWDIARRLLHDDSLKTDDRLAGLLLLLYAQGASTISHLTVDQVHIHDRTVRIHLGRAPIHLPDPVAELARTVVANRKGHATIGARRPSPWLFPGGQPGRPISTAQLTLRLNRLGIRPNQARSTALFQLATEIPAAILARTLGINIEAAVRWQRLAAGDWTAYAADISRRTTQSPRHSDSLNT